MLSGAAAEKPRFLSGRSAVVWSRAYSAATADHCDCKQLREVLARVPGASRMVVGHTIQEGGINSACEGRVLRVDVGLSRGCGDGSPEVGVMGREALLMPLQHPVAGQGRRGRWTLCALLARPLDCPLLCRRCWKS